MNPGYVRHRCLPHIAWISCDAAIKVSGLDYRALAAYLNDGITWSRSRRLATKVTAYGGLGLFKDGSHKCKDIFGKSPSAIVDGRPETDLRFLKLLAGKEHVLHMLATKDLSEKEFGNINPDCNSEPGDHQEQDLQESPARAPGEVYVLDVVVWKVQIHWL